MNYEEWLKKGIQNIETEIEPEKVFELKELFIGFGWEQLSKGERISFGRYFSAVVKAGKIPNIVKVEKGTNNHTRYKKIVL